MEPLYDFSLDLTRWMQVTYPQLLGFFKFVSELGVEAFYLAALPLLYWCVDKRLGKHLAYIFLLANIFNPLLKHALRQPRPFWLDANVGLDTETSYGIPSGHAQTALVVYFFLAAWVRRRWVWLAALFMVVIMGLSRIYLGIHFFQDVLAGYLIGILILLGYFVWQRYFTRQFGRRILGYRLMVVIALPIVLALVYAGTMFVLDAPDTSVAWAAHIPDAERNGIESVATGVGALLGLSVGMTLEGSRVRFRADGPYSKRIVRYVLGIFITVALWAGLGAVFPSDPLWLAIPLRVLRYLLLLLWVSYYGPMAFVAFKLAEAEPPPEINLKLT